MAINHTNDGRPEQRFIDFEDIKDATVNGTESLAVYFDGEEDKIQVMGEIHMWADKIKHEPQFEDIVLCDTKVKGRDGDKYHRHPEIATFPTQPFFSHPDSILLPTGTQIRHLSWWQVQLAPRPKIVCTFDTQTLLYCPFTPYYSGITAVMVEWVPDARHCFFLGRAGTPYRLPEVT
jgi:hypothetical protein